MWQFNPRAYGPNLAQLLARAPLNELGPGQAEPTARPVLAALSPASLVAPHDVINLEMAAACSAGLWLRFDFLAEAHHIAQSLDSPEGSFWHGILHRREPDFSNAKYWFRRVGYHPIFPRLAKAAQALAAENPGVSPAHYLTEQADWDSLRFVDLCDEALDASPPLHRLCQRIQQVEWELLFDYAYQRAREE